MPVGVGVVGASTGPGWARDAHVAALSSASGLRLAAVATTRPETAAAAAAEFGVERGYVSAEALAADPTVNLVTVAVRVTAHRAAVEAAIRARIPVYCEWPLGVTTAEAVALRDAARDAGVPTVIGLQARRQPALREMRRAIADGAIGDVISVAARTVGMGHGAPVLPPEKAWVADERNGLSALTVRAAHTLDAVRFAVGSVEVVSSAVDVHRGSVRLGADGPTTRKSSPDRVLVSGRLGNGAPVDLIALLGAHGTGAPLLTVYGTEGTLELVPDERDGQIQMTSLSLFRTRGERRNRIVVMESRPSGLTAAARSVQRMYEAYARHETLPDFDDAVTLHALLDDVRAAAAAP